MKKMKREHPARESLSSTGPTIEAVPRPQTLGERIAQVISLLGSPPAMAIGALVAIAIQVPPVRFWPWGGLYIALALVTPLIFLLWQLHHGKITDLDIHFRQQRHGSLAVTIAGLAVTWGIMYLGGAAPPALLLMAGTGFLQWTAIYLVTLRWKISIHTTAASGVILFLIWALGTAATPLILIIPLVSWSRIKLRRHTLAQVMAGILLGSLAFILALLLSPAACRSGARIR